MHGRVMTIKTLVYFGPRRRRTGRCLPFRALMGDWMTDYGLRAPLPHIGCCIPIGPFVVGLFKEL